MIMTGFAPKCSPVRTGIDLRRDRRLLNLSVRVGIDLRAVFRAFLCAYFLAHVGIGHTDFSLCIRG